MASIQRCNQICKRTTTGDLAQGTERTRSTKIYRVTDRRLLWRRQRRGESDEGFVLRLQGGFNIAIQFLVCTGSLGGVKITSTNDMTVRRVEIQCTGDIVKVAERKELNTLLTLMSLEGEERRENETEIGNSFAITMISRTFILRCSGVADFLKLTGKRVRDSGMDC